MIISKTKILFFFLYFNSAFCQSFIPLDIDTNEFIEDVNYKLFLNKSLVFSSICFNDKKTNLPLIDYDSIVFSKVNYATLGLKKDNLNQTVLLSKIRFELDEIIVASSNKQDIVLGEQNRFVNRKSNSISKEMNSGIVFENEYKTNLDLQKMVFYVDKVKYKTAYRINFNEFKQVPLAIGHQNAEIGDLIFSTDTLYLEPKQKGAIEIALNEKNIVLDKKAIFISFELLANYDQNNNQIQLSFDESTKLKFQLSNKTNYYARMFNIDTQKLSDKLVNMNALYNYDFAFMFYKKPPKSILVSPAVLLYTRKKID